MNFIKESYFEVKKSKFYGYLYQVDDKECVEDIINSLWKKNKKARHVVYAYKINGQEKRIDDGEPSGTAGKPILDIINHKDEDNILVVVVRYFGGVKLGAGPLTRAYSKCCSILFK